MIENSDISQIQKHFIEAVINGGFFLGMHHPLDLPDMQKWRSQNEYFVENQNIANPQAFLANVTLLESSEIKTFAERLGPFAFIRFSPPVERGEAVKMRLELLIGFDDVDPLGLGAIIVTFERNADMEWKPQDQSHVLAY